MSFRSFVLSVASNKLVERFVRASFITRGIVRRFIAGEGSESAVAVAESFVQRGYKASLDCLGEHVSQEHEADAAEAEYLELLRRISRSIHCGNRAPENMNISIKLSQLGMLLNSDHCLERLLRILTEAEKSKNFVRIDMEDSSTIDATLDLVARARKTHTNVGIVLQAMLLRTPDDVEFAIRERLRVRLVKGAYLEKKEVAYQKKGEIDAAYFCLGKRLLEAGAYTAIATHDPRLCQELCEHAAALGIGKGRFEFQMLYGINRPLQESLHKRGYTVRIYIPYGKSWYPYFSRRIAERPANMLFFLKSLFRK